MVLQVGHLHEVTLEVEQVELVGLAWHRVLGTEDSLLLRVHLWHALHQRSHEVGRSDVVSLVTFCLKMSHELLMGLLWHISDHSKSLSGFSLVYHWWCLSLACWELAMDPSSHVHATSVDHGLLIAHRILDEIASIHELSLVALVELDEEPGIDRSDIHLAQHPDKLINWEISPILHVERIG